MHTARRQDVPKTLHPVRQKVRVYNPSLLSELLVEAEKAQQAQVRGSMGSCTTSAAHLKLY